MAEFNPALLLLARQYRGESQSAVARGAGINQGHYSRIENGLVIGGPAEDTIDRIADFLGFPMHFFYQEDGLAGLPLSIHPMNRRKQSVRETVLRSTHAGLNVRLIHIRRLLRAVDIEPELPLPVFDVDDDGGPQEIARAVRTTWSVPPGPLANLTELCERAGILIVHCSFDAPIDGVTMMVRDLPPCIFLNRDVPADRMRSSLAHELGHVVMHRVPTDQIENEANAFASELLVPERPFRQSVIGHRITLEWLARQKAFWRVSMNFLLYRIGALGLMTRHQSEYLWKKLSALGWRTREPEETDFAHEAPAVFPRIVRMHAEELGYKPEDLAGLLCSSEAEVWKHYGSMLAPGGKAGLRVVK